MGNRLIEHDLFGTEPRPKRVNGDAKGKNNERTCARWLSKWTGAQFNRTPQSGGMHLKNQLFCGDLVCITEGFYFPFVIETKHLKNLHVTPDLRDNSKLFTIFRQAKRDADRIGKRPMCLIRCNRMAAGEYVLILEDEFSYKLAADAFTRGIEHIAYGQSRADDLTIRAWIATDLRDVYKWERFCRLLGITGSKLPA